MSRTYRKIPTSQRSALPGSHWFWSKAAEEHHRTVADYLADAEEEKRLAQRTEPIEAAAASVIAGEPSPALAVN